MSEPLSNSADIDIQTAKDSYSQDIEELLQEIKSQENHKECEIVWKLNESKYYSHIK